MIAIGSFYPPVTANAQEFVKSIDFNEALMNCMLSYLLFAGALHVNMTELKKQSGIVAIMATIGVTLTTFAVGTIAYYIFSMLGVQIQYSSSRHRHEWSSRCYDYECRSRLFT